MLTRVEALDVGRRVGLGVAARLGLGEHLGVVAALAGHRREHVVRRPVDDPAHARDRGSRRGPARAARARGIPPPTAASNRSGTSASRASRSSSGPWWATMCLFAVTTALPARERRRDERVAPARRRPSISTMTSMSGARDEVRRRVGQQRLRDAGGDRPLGELLGPRPRRARAARRRTGARRGDRSRNARTTSRPTVPAPMHADAQGLDAHGAGSRDGVVLAAMVANAGRCAGAPSGAIALRYTPPPMTVELAPAPAPAAAPAPRARGSSRASSRPGSSTSATTWARSATT